MGQATIIGLEVLHNTRAFDTNGTSEVIGAIRERLHVHGRQSAYLELTSKDWRKAYLGKASGVDFRETYNHVRSCVTGFPELGRVRDGKTPKRALDHITDAACVALYVHDFPDGRKVA